MTFNVAYIVCLFCQNPTDLYVIRKLPPKYCPENAIPDYEKKRIDNNQGKETVSQKF